MFRNSHQLDMGVTHLLYIGSQLGGSFLIGYNNRLFPVGFSFSRNLSAPRRYVMAASHVDALAFLNPGRVIPVEVITECGDGGGSRPVLRVLGKGSALKITLPVWVVMANL